MLPFNAASKAGRELALLMVYHSRAGQHAPEFDLAVGYCMP